MLGHLGVNVPDLGVARAYYGEVMPMLGYEPFIDAHDEFAYMPAAGKRGTYLFFYPALDDTEFSRHGPGLQHLAFMVPTRTAVAQVYERVRDLGSDIVHEPQVFPQYPPPYYATFWSDPFGFMVEAVCHHARE